MRTKEGKEKEANGKKWKKEIFEPNELRDVTQEEADEKFESNGEADEKQEEAGEKYE